MGAHGKPELIETPKGPMTRRQAAAAFGIPFGTLCRRIWLKQPPELVFGPSRRAPPKPVLPPATRFRGRFMTAWGRMKGREIAYKIGITHGALCTRMYCYKWTLEQAFNTPPFGRAGYDFIMPVDEFRARCAEHWRAEKQARDGR